MMHTPKFSILAYKMLNECKISMSRALTKTANITFEYNDKSFQREIEKKQYDIIFIDLAQGNGTTFNLLKSTHSLLPYTPIIITSESQQANFIEQALLEGAQDFLTPPFSTTRIKIVVQNALKRQKLQNEIDYLHRKQDIVYNFDGIVAESQNFKAVIKNLKKFAATDSTILITGKTGTGKSFLSGTIHYNSPRKKQPFIKINCANIPESLLESELFGHEKGSFTGADKQRIGRFEQANGGTIFLDEIGEIPLEIQAKLLRVIEEKAFERVGGNKTIEVNVRIIAATNKNLPNQVADGKFREDLFYRINVLPVALPSLQERRQCIIPLAQRLLEKGASSMKRSLKGFSPEALVILQNYEWPGNIRQLANTIERAIILEEDETIRPDSIHLPEQIVRKEQGGDVHHFKQRGNNTKNALMEHEKELILQALENNLWVQKNAAQKLGISPRALNYKIKKFGIAHPNWRKHKSIAPP